MILSIHSLKNNNTILTCGKSLESILCLYYISSFDDIMLQEDASQKLRFSNKRKQLLKMSLWTNVESEIYMAHASSLPNLDKNRFKRGKQL